MGCGLIFSGTSFAAAFEQSNQSIQSFFEKNNYAEVSLAWVRPDISGQVQHTEELQQLGITDFSTGNLVHNQLISNVALKFQLNPQVSWELIYDQPYSIDIAYHYDPAFAGATLPIEAATIQFESHNLTSLIGFQPNDNWNFYTGLSYQSLEGNLYLSGQTFYIFNGYRATFERDAARGWLAGISYQIQEYFFRTALTYRSAITHHNKTTESIIVGTNPAPYTEIQTPQSVNLDFQTALTDRNALYGTLRWSNWQNFVIQPPKFGAVIDYAALQFPEVKPFRMIDYREDQWSGKIGLAYQWPSFGINSIELLWDSGTGNPASTLNPSDGYWGIGLGHLYKIQETWDIATGLYYLKFQKPEISLSEPITPQIAGLSAISDNSAWILGLKLGYHF
ncbi:outer membrane protein transport protein [Acinetobacter variabilis]|uniref:OmpP1/FadL family transporter n=1 Tax=Acinetobacter variabilis TaxID=70346 RepID=UPI0021CD451A|nr:outer membrane protein transport protein [Acinetobacter variabilis]MCU4364635.1 outer membrane protein transport protein [Acinetobacter variabilis]MCU4374620.1 outer membrane protein transport protein [Acinetobacter variabilis]